MVRHGQARRTGQVTARSLGPVVPPWPLHGPGSRHTQPRPSPHRQEARRLKAGLSQDRALAAGVGMGKEVERRVDPPVLLTLTSTD